MANKLSPAWLVDGETIYEPGPNVSVQHENIAGSNSGRAEDGTMYIDWVRRDVRKVGITYNYLSQNELDFMINKLQGKEFSFTFMDRGELVTIQAYCSNCSYTMYNYNIYTDVSFSIIEK